MKYRREGCSPEKATMERADGVQMSAGHGAAGEKASLLHSPGVSGLTELGMRMYGNHGDPGGSAEGVAQPLTSLNSEEEVRIARKSESPIVAMKFGNASGAKGWQYWDNESMVNMPRHRADSAHDH